MIGISRPNQTLVCRRCNALPEKVSVEGMPYRSRIRCPDCGVNADYNGALDAAKRYAAEDMAKEVQKQVANTVRNMKFLTYKPGRVVIGSMPDFIFRGNTSKLAIIRKK